ncbi:hypothetical protein [Stenotrophomonas sp.]|uniref:hypothetical protein n=1 Tax=Stenotrophomonas sp. TaxID=69392 RepID=UPI0028B261BF|nr:hypothetical protein [Stenotrophomonas sp.]
MSIKKPTSKKATKKPVAKTSRTTVRAAPSAAMGANVLMLDDFESQIQKFYSMSKKHAVEAAKKAGILTPTGRLSGAYR